MSNKQQKNVASKKKQFAVSCLCAVEVVGSDFVKVKCNVLRCFWYVNETVLREPINALIQFIVFMFYNRKKFRFLFV